MGALYDQAQAARHGGVKLPHCVLVGAVLLLAAGVLPLHNSVFATGPVDGSKKTGDASLKSSDGSQKPETSGESASASAGVQGSRPVGVLGSSPPAVTPADTVPESLSTADLATDPERMLAEIDSLEVLAKQDSSLSELAQKAIAEQLTSARSSLQRRETLAAKAADFSRAIGTIDEELEVARKRLSEAVKPATFNFSNDDSLEQRANVLKQLLEHPETGWEAVAARMSLDLSNRSQHAIELQEQLVKARQRLGELDRAGVAKPGGDEPALVRQAQVLDLAARRSMTSSELVALQAEAQLLDHPASLPLLQDQRALVLRQIQSSKDELAVVRHLLDQRRQLAAVETLRQTKFDAAAAHPLLKPVAAENSLLAEENAKVIARLANVDTETKSAVQRRDALSAELNRVKQMVAAVGLTDAVGSLLRRQREGLSRLEQIEDRLAARAEETRDARLRLFDLDDELTHLVDPATRVATILRDANKSTDDVDDFKASGVELVARTQSLLTELRRNYDLLFKALVALDATEHALLENRNEYRNFVDERVLWIRSHTPFSTSQLKAIVASVPAGIAAQPWQQLTQTLHDDFFAHPWLYAAFLAGCIPLLVLRKNIRRELERFVDNTEIETAATLRALLMTILLAAGPLLLVAGIGRRLVTISDSGSFIAALGQGLYFTAVSFFPVELMRLVCHRRGLAELCFRWPDDERKRIYRGMRWLWIFGFPLLLTTTICHSWPVAGVNDSLGRLSFVLLMVVLAVLVLQMFFRRRKPLVDQHVWDYRVRSGLQLIGLSGPLALAVLTLMGYYYTATELGVRLEYTAWLVTVLTLVEAMVLEWIAQQRRRLAIAHAQELLDAAEKELTEAPDAAGMWKKLFWSAHSHDVSSIVNQVERLLHMGTLVFAVAIGWAIWADTVPALGFLEQFTLWQTTVTESFAEPEGSNGVGAVTRQVLRPITLADLGASMLVIGLTIFASRNLPGLIEVTLLKRMAVDRGVQVAVVNLASYVLVIVGCVLGLGRIGIGWSNVQWLVAAATVGLGFGLQEIFANFVSGIIVLFERPIREGDVVTIGDTTGTVARIRIRATTIVDFDRKELIVPNKEFITGKLLNWTLSDKINRVIVKVGVSYATNPNEMQAVLLSVAAGHPLILKEPAPLANLEGFGNSTLDFVLRVYLDSLDHRIQVMHDLHTHIYQACHEKQIDISYQQLDVRIHRIREPLRPPGTNGAGTVAERPAIPNGSGNVLNDS